jgi:threonine/homoserine/homoserine lactone efflux protein
MNSALLISFIAAVILIDLLPGPDMFYIIATGISSGAHAGVVAAVGMSTGLAVHTVAAALGLGALLNAVPLAMNVVRLLGVGALFYLAIGQLQAAKSASYEPVPTAPKHSLRRVYGMAVATNLANPKVVLFFVAFLPQFTSHHADWPASVQLLVLGGLFIAISIVIDMATGLAAGRLSDFLSRRHGFQRWLARFSAVTFVGLAMWMAVDVVWTSCLE